jgi:hypothetical protein
MTAAAMKKQTLVELIEAGTDWSGLAPPGWGERAVPPGFFPDMVERADDGASAEASYSRARRRDIVDVLATAILADLDRSAAP